MSKISIVQADFDYNTPLILEFNEITTLMAISSVGIVVILVLSLFVAGKAFFGKKTQELSEEHFTRS